MPSGLEASTTTGGRNSGTTAAREGSLADVPDPTPQDRATATLEYLQRQGCCLWVGAGIDKYLTRGEAPTWSQFIGQLETTVSNPASNTASLPKRAKWFEKFEGRAELIERVKQHIVAPARDAIRQICEDAGMPAGITKVPSEFENLARLGRIANPIVNFNYTTWASALLRKPSGSMKLRAVEDDRTDSEDAVLHVPVLDVIHPHGIAGEFGDGCVITDGDYERKERLAFRVATAAAYHKPLAIVGMSLDDEYLREQLRDFRSEIGRVFWFCEGSSDASSKIEWMRSCNIEVINLETWEQFWEAVGSTLESPPAADLDRCLARIAHSVGAGQSATPGAPS